MSLYQVLGTNLVACMDATFWDSLWCLEAVYTLRDALVCMFILIAVQRLIKHKHVVNTASSFSGTFVLSLDTSCLVNYLTSIYQHKHSVAIVLMFVY